MLRLSLKSTFLLVLVIVIGILVLGRFHNSNPISFPHDIRDLEGSTDSRRGFTSSHHQMDYEVALPPEPQGPSWSQRNGNPPLSAAKAVRLAIEAREKTVQGDRWKLHSCSLFPWVVNKGIWYWQVRFVWDDGSRQSEFGVIVLMDGTVLPHTETPW